MISPFLVVASVPAGSGSQTRIGLHLAASGRGVSSPLVPSKWVV